MRTYAYYILYYRYYEMLATYLYQMIVYSSCLLKMRKKFINFNFVKLFEENFERNSSFFNPSNLKT
jgi:hypothetical protein